MCVLVLGQVNGYFELSSNRRDIWFGDGLSGEGLLRAQWNLALLSDVIAPCYARAVTSLAGSSHITPEQHVQLFPQAQPPAPWDTLAHAFFKLVGSKPCLFTEANGGAWILPSTSIVVRRDAPQYARFLQWLLDDGFHVVRNLPDELEKLLVKTTTIQSFLKPSRVRKGYKSGKSRHAGDSNAIQCVLDFMLSDLRADDLLPLIGVNFLPLADGSLVPFARQSAVDPDALSQLCSMGFSRQHSIRALEMVGGRDVEAGLNWLIQNPNPSTLADSGVIYLIPNADELALLAAAKAGLVATDALSAKSTALLASEQAHRQLNVKKMDFQGFEDMLAVVLPSDWYGKATVAWDCEGDAEPTAEWFRQLWKYVGPSPHLSSLQGKWPIVPTSTGVLTTLSKSTGVIASELIPPGCLRCLHQLEVRLLLPSLLSSFHPDPSVWQHIHQPTPGGVLSCVGALTGPAHTTRTQSMKRVFKSAGMADRDQLRTFLMSAQPDELDVEQLAVCRQLPIFHGFLRAAEMQEDDRSWLEADAEDRAQILTSSEFTPVFASLESVHRETRSPLFMCMGIAWKFLDDSFVFVREGDTLMWKFLLSLGVRAVSKVDFFVHHLIPRFQLLPHESRIEFIYQLLLELNALLAQDTHGKLSSIVESATIFPTASGELKAIADLYDPEIDDFAELMDDTFFPAMELQDAQPLSVLRSLGLQRTISRRSILSLAMSIENEQIKLRRDAGERAVAAVETAQLRSRASALFKYLDAHMAHLMSVESAQQPKRVKANIKAKGLRFLRSFGLPSQSESVNPHVSDAEVLEQQIRERQEIEAFATQLAVIEWVPVNPDKPHPAAPLLLEEEGEQEVVVTTPQKARQSKSFWLCSARYHIVHGVVYSDKMSAAFGWNVPVSVDVIAYQLKRISENFVAYAACTSGHLDTQQVWSAVYGLYKTLSDFFESQGDVNRRQEVLSVLSVLSGNSKYVWVGNRFVSSNQVAMSALVTAEPYLYTIPNELVHFRPFWKAIGVQERFSLADYVHAIRSMHAKYQQPLESQDNGGSELALALSSDEVVTAISLLQLISDLLPYHSDYELFAPDTTGVLVHTAQLTFDDTPWLDESGRGASINRLRFIHPKISNEVAHKLGCKSLRSHLLHTNQADATLFRVESGVEAFGQTEALTKRISHILEQYPDGPNIISELIQNADDAGASRVALLYNSATYGVSSLLSPGMAKWQGPALYCVRPRSGLGANSVPV